MNNLKVDIKTSNSNVIAGKEFSIAIEIKNISDKPITIKSVSSKLPTEFRDIKTEQRIVNVKNVERELKDFISEYVPDLKKDKRKELLKEMFKEAVRLIPFGGVLVASSVAGEYIKASTSTPKKKTEDKPDESSLSELKQILDSKIEDDSLKEEVKTKLNNIVSEQIRKLNDFLDESITLQPNNSTVYIFTLMTKKNFFFRPSKYELHIELFYEKESVENTENCPFPFIVDSSMESISLGAVFGNILGFVAKDINSEKQILNYITERDSNLMVLLILSLISSIIISVFGVLIFKRKKDVQGIVTIEDFWGGMLLGFIIAFAGYSFIENYIGE